MPQVADGAPRFSMAAGDFVEVYGAADAGSSWDAVVTCFFIDTAPVVMEYIEAIFKMLKPGAYWINIGPLLYHWSSSMDSEGNYEDDRYSQSVELSWDELKHVMQRVGFVFLEERWVECHYTRPLDTMMFNTYRAKFFTVQKPF